MNKPEIKFEEGKLKVNFTYGVDTDHDTKPAATLTALVDLNPAEVVSEIAKKDLAWLETLLAQIKG